MQPEPGVQKEQPDDDSKIKDVIGWILILYMCYFFARFTYKVITLVVTN